MMMQTHQWKCRKVSLLISIGKLKIYWSISFSGDNSYETRFLMWKSILISIFLNFPFFLQQLVTFGICTCCRFLSILLRLTRKSWFSNYKESAWNLNASTNSTFQLLKSIWFLIYHLASSHHHRRSKSITRRSFLKSSSSFLIRIFTFNRRFLLAHNTHAEQLNIGLLNENIQLFDDDNKLKRFQRSVSLSLSTRAVDINFCSFYFFLNHQKQALKSFEIFKKKKNSR